MIAEGSRTGRAEVVAECGDRWATFDCYGTLIDWNGGIAASSRASSARSGPTRCSSATTSSSRSSRPTGRARYREVLTEAMRGLGAPPEEEDALAQSLPSWQPFPEVPAR